MSHIEGIYEPYGGFLLTTTGESAEYNEGNYEPRKASGADSMGMAQAVLSGGPVKDRGTSEANDRKICYTFPL